MKVHTIPQRLKAAIAAFIWPDDIAKLARLVETRLSEPAATPPVLTPVDTDSLFPVKEWVRGCTDKRQYKDVSHALQACAAIKKQDPSGSGRLTVYTCQRCNSYHIGNKRDQ